MKTGNASRPMHTNALTRAAVIAGVMTCLSFPAASPAAVEAAQAAVAVTRQTIPAVAPASTCVACHATQSHRGMITHLAEWEQSVHAKNGVGCAGCHGGDPIAMDIDKVHARVVRALDRAKEHLFCGKCHAEATAQFARNKHFPFVQSGNRLMPTCTACHGEVAAETVPPVHMAGFCGLCHGVGKSAERPEYVAGIRLLLVQQQSVMQMIGEIRVFLDGLPAGPLRADFASDLGRIQSEMHAASGKGHVGDDRGLAAALSSIQREIVDLLQRLMKRPDTP